jgi:hypothetical protein
MNVFVGTSFVVFFNPNFVEILETFVFLPKKRLILLVFWENSPIFSYHQIGGKKENIAHN